MVFHERVFCGQVSESDVGQSLLLAGWVDAFRDHGGLLFIHLRDRSGILQVVFSPEVAPPEVCTLAATLRTEFCIAVRGTLVQRQAGTENPNIETGTIELMVKELTVLTESDTLPFTISEKAMVASATAVTDTVSEDTRLQYRYLTCCPSMRDHLTMRHRIFQCVRRFSTRRLPRNRNPGADRQHARRRARLSGAQPRPSENLLRATAVASDFQAAPHGGWPRATSTRALLPRRRPAPQPPTRFTRFDIEASFIDEEFLYEMIEELTVRPLPSAVSPCAALPRMTYAEAMDDGSDKPDLRFGLRFVDVTDVFTQTRYAIFRQILQRGGCIKGLNIKGQSEKLSKNVLQNEYAKEIAPSFGAKGMTWMRAENGKLESNIVQFFSEQELDELRRRFKVEDGDVLIMIADSSARVVASALGNLRLHLANRLGLIPPDTFCPLWVTDFPLFEPTDEGGVTSTHHPFTAPHRTDFDPSNVDELLSLRSRAYDLIVNGEELGGGSIRIHNRAVQRKIFAALGLSDEDVQTRFGFFLRAFDFGAPPHGGLALGMDRLVSMILQTPSIREVIAFPKNRSAACPLTGAPSTVTRTTRRVELARSGRRWFRLRATGCRGAGRSHRPYLLGLTYRHQRTGAASHGSRARAGRDAGGASGGTCRYGSAHPLGRAGLQPHPPGHRGAAFTLGRNGAGLQKRPGCKGCLL